MNTGNRNKIAKDGKFSFQPLRIAGLSLLLTFGLTAGDGNPLSRIESESREKAPGVSLNASAQIPGVLLPPRVPPTYTYQVVNTWAHDSQAFTQGLVFHEGLLYESTGLYGSSSLRKVELTTGQVLFKISVPNQYFAEGLAILNNRAIQLTWQNNVGFVYDLASFNSLQSFAYSGEGWGLTHDGHSLIMSDGTNAIRFLDPVTFQVQRVIFVLDGNVPLRRLNELEFVDGEIFANVWLTDRIVRFSPDTGRINSWVDLTGLLPPGERPSSDAVLNGIAYDAAQKRLFVTGKLWPKLYEIKLKPKRGRAERP